MGQHLVSVGLILSAVTISFGCQSPVNEVSRIAEVEHGLLPFTAISGEPGMDLLERMQKYQVPGVSIAVIDGGEIQWIKHYGVTDVRQPLPVDDTTLFNVGSMSKAVTSAIILSLVRDGLIDLNAPVNQQLRSWQLPENDLMLDEPVTPIRLMNHSGGVVFSPGFAYRTEDLPSFEQLLEGEPPAKSGPVRVDRIPGSGFQYSNPGYSILRKLAEDVTGKPFAEIAAERVFEPLGMSRSTFVVPLPPDLLTSAAMGHRLDGSPDADVHRWCGHVAAGGLWTTTADYAAFVVELQGALRGDSTRLLNRELAELMVEPHDAREYGLGLFLRESLGERKYVGHIGDGPGFVGGFTTDTRGNFGVVVLTNGQGGIDLVREVRRAVANVYEWPDNLPPARLVIAPDSTILESAAGRYRVGFDDVATIERSGESLRLTMEGLPDVEMLPVGDATFVCRERVGEISFERAGDGEITRMVFHLSDEHGRLGDEGISLPRMAADELTPLELLLAGRTSAATDLYLDLLESDPSSPAVSENRLNRLGYQYLAQGRQEDAVAVFLLYVGLHPGSANAHDSLGEALMKTGRLEAAVASYRRSLELNPANDNAVVMIEKIESMTDPQ